MSVYHWQINECKTSVETS